MLSTAKVVILLFAVRMTLNAGVFRYHRAARIGDPIYFLYLEDKLQCLRACYEESECAVVEHRENEEGLCRLSKQGDSETVVGFTFSREETDASCKLIELLNFDVSFQMIRPQNIAITKPKKCSSMPNVTVLQPYDRPKYRFFVLNSTKVPEDWVASEFRHSDLRRLYFGEIYNITGYYFYNAYAFGERCVSAADECLGTVEIQEYVDTQGNFFYDKTGKIDMVDSGLGQTFFIAGKEY